MSDQEAKRQEFVEAIRAWYFADDPEKMLQHLRGRYQELHEQYWEVKRENNDLYHENRALREGHIPESVSWLMMKKEAQRQEIRRLRKKLGYKDSPDE